jgi:hypothetical protein
VKVAYFSIIYYYTSFEDIVLISKNVTQSSQIRASSILLLIVKS